MKTTRNLSLIITIWIGIAFVVSVFVCVLVESLLNNDALLPVVLLHHARDFLLSSILICCLCWLVIHIVLVEPIRLIDKHLYHAGSGNLHPIELSTSSSEVRNIVDGINVMLWRLNQRPNNAALNGAQQTSKEIKDLVMNSPELDAYPVMEVLDRLEQLDVQLHEIPQNNIDAPIPKIIRSTIA